MGPGFIDFSFFVSGALLVTSGILNTTASNKKLAAYTAIAAILFYMPFMWQGLVIYRDFFSVGFGLFILMFPFFFIVAILRKSEQPHTHEGLGDGET